MIPRDSLTLQARMRQTTVHLTPKGLRLADLMAAGKSSAEAEEIVDREFTADGMSLRPDALEQNTEAAPLHP